MNFFDQFGIQPVLLIAQAVNFLILLFLLNKFLYKPILKILEQRRQKIAQGLEDSAKIASELQKIEEMRDQKIDEAMTEAKTLILDAESRHQEIIDSAKSQAEVQIVTMITQAKIDIQNQYQVMEQTLKSEISGLIITSLEKIISTDLPAIQRAKITQKIAKEFKN